MSIYNKVSELEWYLCQKALLKEFLSKNAYEKYLSDLDRFHAEWEGLHEPKIVETENKSALAVYSPINAMLVLSPGAELNLPLGYLNLSEQVAKLMHLPFERIDQGEEWKKI